jgi:hypothetical protein
LLIKPNSILFLPWGLNYDYLFSEKLALGLHSYLVIQELEVDLEDSTISRSRPVTACLMILYKPFGGLSFLAGEGKEFEPSENFNVISLGLEFGIDIPKEWEINFNFLYDIRLEAYQSFLFGIGFSKKLR